MATSNGSRRGGDYYRWSPKDEMWYMGRGRAHPVTEEEVLAIMGQIEDEGRTRHQARVQKNRKAGAKKAKATRKKNFVTKKVPRDSPIEFTGYYQGAKVTAIKRTSNEGRGSRINTNPYQGKGARKGQMESSYKGVKYKSYPNKGRY